MFIDASALTALLVDEADGRELLARMQAAKTRVISPLAVWEAALAVARILHLKPGEVRTAIDDYLELMDIVVVAVPPEAWRAALTAHDRFGKGRHPARLNFGDCFAYACARHYGQPLMFKGGDFALTDIEAA
jgi:ribonuclease VapC